MDSTNELNELLGNADHNLLQLSSNFSSLKNKNECEQRREHTQVNKLLLTNTMHEWTPVIDSQFDGDSKNKRDVEFVKPSERNAANASVKYMSQDGGLGGDVMRLLQSVARPVKIDAEDRFADQIARLQTERSNRMHHEQMMAKNRLGRKIKSKGFHRHAKRREMKQFLKADANDADGATRDGLEDKFDKIRARERISLKHKIGGKFAKIQKLRAKYDRTAREALNEMHEEGQRRTARLDGDDDDEGEEEEAIEDVEEGDEDDMVAIGDGAAMRNSSAHAAATFTQATSGPAGTAPDKVVAQISTSHTGFLQYDRSTASDGDDDDDGLLTDEARFKQAIYQVYQQDETLAAEFERDKADLVDAEKPADLQLFQPGWGTWTGPGFETADERRRKQGLLKAPQDKARKDRKKTRVWIRQGVHDGLKKHLVKSIPFPYNTAEQFNVSRSELVSSVFNLQTVHRQLTRPAFVNKAGQPIYPRQRQEKRL